MTTDGGANFTPIFDAEPTLAIGAVALDPAPIRRRSMWVPAKLITAAIRTMVSAFSFPVISEAPGRSAPTRARSSMSRSRGLRSILPKIRES